MIDLLRVAKWKFLFPVFRRKFRNTSLNEHLIKNYGGSNVNRKKLLDKKKSDTLFILATGQSINNLKPEYFQIIAQHDSIGVNGFGYHSFVPNFYSFELENQDNPVALKMFLDVSERIQQNISNYSDTIFVFRQNKMLNKDLGEFVQRMFALENSYWNVYDTIPGHTIEDYESYLLWYDKVGLFKKNDFFPNKSSSLSWVISMAYQMKYKNIVFCGVDLCGDHFYKNPQPVNDKTFQQNSAKLHRTGSAAQNGIAIQDIIKVWNKHFFKETGSKLYTASKYSLLAEFLPVYNFPEA